jgi:hypothetical protein
VSKRILPLDLIPANPRVSFSMISTPPRGKNFKGFPVRRKEALHYLKYEFKIIPQ